MSTERFEKNQRGYPHSAYPPLGRTVVKRLTVGQPSEWSSLCGYIPSSYAYDHGPGGRHVMRTQFA